MSKCKNNEPVADFFCEECKEKYELKSKKGKFSNKVIAGTYETMVERINSNNNPNFFFLTYSEEWSVENFFIIPKQFFTEDIIIEIPRLSENAKRSDWVGCNIDISKIPDAGKVFLVISVLTAVHYFRAGSVSQRCQYQPVRLFLFSSGGWPMGQIRQKSRMRS